MLIKIKAEPGEGAKVLDNLKTKVLEKAKHQEEQELAGLEEQYSDKLTDAKRKAEKHQKYIQYLHGQLEKEKVARKRLRIEKVQARRQVK